MRDQFKVLPSHLHDFSLDPVDVEEKKNVKFISLGVKNLVNNPPMLVYAFAAYFTPRRLYVRGSFLNLRVIALSFDIPGF